MVRVHVQQGWQLGGGCPYPVAFLWIGNDLVDGYPCGTWDLRVSWLPSWLPFNKRWNHSLRAQAVLVQRLTRRGQELEAAGWSPS